ncbi:MAG: FemAB family protein [Candidatus Woesebacteria bacterium GW2011_GWA1_33_30]|uniref:FemAB family protein n=1 Tax=Candidatus Woesebacteria bacterium GW2011_GWA2_33_28 TaxID=1618561 RepID=A0A0G0C8Y5_9BACT|nr:MAG: FemAB family protein [Candidatus Woesebacteria bacterium GW2011_GWA2_33_28]KKP48498.1 MAG: FemAB family protein [Candidatus Woesebacteria bacterium GW2011_GWA1_33_30]KKP49636.1 MAG: FemAB family protein [Microgenomates group bacterium GW2011_GWC1_33_32]KKP52253.1 MAG: FemAB family protein [Candidatus Woesebacteria bacterium GW2011_GWB1_33_38]
MTHPLQTKEWGEFRKEWGNEVHFEKNSLIIFSKIPYTNFKIGTCLKCGPIAESDPAMFRNIGKKYNAIFIKFEPNISNNESVKQLLSKSGLVRGKTLFTPTTFWIDLTKSEEELLKSFSSKTRYNIRLAQKHEVKVRIDNSDKAFEKYLELTFETAKRQGFYAHTEKYHRLMWKHLKDKIAHLLIATYKGEIISTWILFTHNDFLYYPYGASTDKYKEVMANNLMMWEAIKYGKKQGLSTFDLWGREEGKGFTKFKEGYNPKVVEFVGSWDLVINKPLYYLYRIAEKARWFFLRLKARV